MRKCLFECGVCEDVDQDLAQFVLVVVVVRVETDAQLLKSEISFSLSLHYNYRISAEHPPPHRDGKYEHSRHSLADKSFSFLNRNEYKNDLRLATPPWYCDMGVYSVIKLLG